MKIADYFYDFVVDGIMHTVAVCTQDKDYNEIPATHDDIVLHDDGGFTFVFVGEYVTQDMLNTARELLS